MPGKAMKCIIEVNLHAVTCLGTFLRDYEYVYVHMEMLGLGERTKSVPSSFPLFFHEKIKFEKTFDDCPDPGYIAAMLKSQDTVIELRQHTDYTTDGRVIAHCSSNLHDFLYPTIPAYYGSGREILLYKTANFKPVRVTGEPVTFEFSTKTVIKEVPDYSSTLRRSLSPTRSSMRRSASPSRKRLSGGFTTVETIPSSLPRHNRSITDPLHNSTVKSLRLALDDLDLSSSRIRSKYRTYTSPSIVQALNSSKRIQRRVDNMILKKTYFDSDLESDLGLDLLRESLREERNNLNDAIKEADREALYRTLNKTH